MVFGGSGFKSAGVLGQLEKVRSRVQKWCRNGSQIQDFGVSWWGPGGSWGGSRGVPCEPSASWHGFGRFGCGPGAVEDRPWGRLGPSWGPLGAVLGPLGLSWGVPGAVLGPLGDVLGASWGVLGALGAVLRLSWATNVRKPNFDDSYTFLHDFGGPRGVPEASWRRLGASWRRLRASWRPLERILGPLGCILEPSWRIFFPELGPTLE